MGRAGPTWVETGKGVGRNDVLPAGGSCWPGWDVGDVTAPREEPLPYCLE